VFPAQEGIEATRRVKDGKEIIFVLNHSKTGAEIVIPFACRDLLTEKSFTASQKFTLPAADVLILRPGA